MCCWIKLHVIYLLWIIWVYLVTKLVQMNCHFHTEMKRIINDTGELFALIIALNYDGYQQNTSALLNYWETSNQCAFFLSFFLPLSVFLSILYLFIFLSLDLVLTFKLGRIIEGSLQFKVAIFRVVSEGFFFSLHKMPYIFYILHSFVWLCVFHIRHKFSIWFNHLQ